MWTTLLLATALAQEPTYDRTAAPADGVEKPVTKLSAGLGAAVTTGNAFAIAASGAVNGSHFWKSNQFKFGAGLNLNYAKIDTDGDGILEDGERGEGTIVPTSQRLTGVLRYDRFFGKMNALYVSAGADRDPFAGLLWRFNQQVGYSRIIVASEKTDLNLEVGVAYNEENFKTNEADLENTENILDAHYLAARVFLGFEHRFNDKVKIGDKLEMYENLFTPVDFRLGNTAYIESKLSDRFSINLSHILLFDNQPASPELRKLDQTTQINLVATIF